MVRNCSYINHSFGTSANNFLYYDRNRGPLTDLFPRLPEITLERLLDIIIDKGFTYNLGHSKLANSRRYTAIVVAHCRHAFSAYDQLLLEKVERYEARRRTADQVWKVLREWSPWDKDNEVLERCFKATLLSPEERDPSWDPMVSTRLCVQYHESCADFC